MNEDDTFKKLKGLTKDEVLIVYQKLYDEAMQSSSTITYGDVCDYIDDRLKPYGWTADKVRKMKY